MNRSDHPYATLAHQGISRPSTAAGRLRAGGRHLVLSFLALVDRRTKPAFLRALHCHYVFDDQKDRFEALMRRLSSIGSFVNTDTATEMVLGKRPIDRKYFHLSFDDGFRNNYTNAFPILRRLGIPAAFFVPSALIEADADTMAEYCLKTTRYPAVIETLRWSDLREMLRHGYDIGSHTRTHARFSDISSDPERLRDEIAGSKAELEARLEYECKYIAWPYGRLSDSDELSRDLTMQAGYTACFGAYRGPIQPGRTPINSIPRHHFEVQWPFPQIEYFARGRFES